MKRLKTRKSFRFKPAFIVFAFIFTALGVFGVSKTVQLAAEDDFGGVRRFIVTFKDAKAVTSLNEEIAGKQRAKILATQNYAKESMTGTDAYLAQVVTYDNLPMAVYEADLNGYKKLQESGLFTSITEDKIIPIEQAKDQTLSTLAAKLPSPVVALGGDPAAEVPFSVDGTPYSGEGYSIAVIDTGVNKEHESLAGKVIFEYCHSTSQDSVQIGNDKYTIKSLCPDNAVSSEGEGAAAPCDDASFCYHGTSVAGAAVGAPKQNITSGAGEYSSADTGGVAPGAKIVAIKVVSEFHADTPNSAACGTSGVCVSQLLSDVLAALDWLQSNAASVPAFQDYPIAAVNISLGSITDFASTATECNAFDVPLGGRSNPFQSIMASLKSMKIATVIAAGNSGNPSDPKNSDHIGKIAFPSCLAPEATAIAATNNDGSRIADFTNNGILTSLLAPGHGVWPTTSANNAYSYEAGTSFAAPIAAGSLAVLREKYPNTDVDTLVAHLQTTGKSITDSRSRYDSVQKPRINLMSALTTDIAGRGELPNTDAPCPYNPSLIFDDPDCQPSTTDPTPPPTPPPTPTPETPQTGFFTTDDGQIKASAIFTSVACLILAAFMLRFMLKKATKKSVSLIKRW